MSTVLIVSVKRVPGRLLSACVRHIHDPSPIVPWKWPFKNPRHRQAFTIGPHTTFTKSLHCDASAIHQSLPLSKKVIAAADIASRPMVKVGCVATLKNGE